MPGPRPTPAAWRSTDEIIDLGRKILEGGPRSQRAKALGVNVASANDYCMIARVFSDQLIGRDLAIDLGALIALSRPGVSEVVRAAAIALAEGGQRVTRKLAEGMIDRQRWSGK
jgi:hypothetical protein